MAEQAQDVPRWVWRLIYRLGKLERGKAYRLTVIMLDGEPLWTIDGASNLENMRNEKGAA